MRDRIFILALFVSLLLAGGCASRDLSTRSGVQETVPPGIATESPLPTPTSDVWTRHIDATGISYLLPPGWRVDDFNPALWMLQPEGGSTPEQANASTLLAPSTENDDWERFDKIQVLTWSATHPKVEWVEFVYPYRLGPDWLPGEVAESFALNDATRVMYFVAPNGVGWQSAPAQADPCCGSLNAWVINLGCRMEITFATSFGAPGPVDLIPGNELTAIVAQHFANFDAIVRSVEFPAPCTEDAPEIPSEWHTVADNFGIEYAIPDGYEFFGGGTLLSDVVEGNVWDMRPVNVGLGEATAVIHVDSRRSINPLAGAPDSRPKWGNFVLSQVVNVANGITMTLSIYSDLPLLNRPAGDAWSSAWVAAALASERCATTALLHSTVNLHNVVLTEETNLAELVAQHAPFLDHAYRAVQFPPECVSIP